MDNPQQERNMRSMSAPPENRQNQQDGRFVSRVDITPQSQQANNQTQQSDQPQREKSPAPQSQKPQQQGNVRHIPIFVEGRDKPVIPKDVDEADFVQPPPRRQQSPPLRPFQKPSSQFSNYARPPGWGAHFGDPFFDEPASRWAHPQFTPHSPFGSEFRHPQEKARTQQSHHPEPPHQQQQHRPQQQHPQQPQQPQQQKPQQQTHQNDTQQQDAAPPKPRQQIQPKDPLEKVALVQKEVDELTEQVKAFTGNSRQDKQYMYLDEMLTRELIKLDDIETEGKDNVRQARKQAIKSIQESINLLESKAPLHRRQQQETEETLDKESTDQQQADSAVTENQDQSEEKPTAEKMETSEAPALEEQQKAIPLPPPLSPTKPTPSEATTATPVVASEPVEQQQNENNSNTQEIQETPQVQVPEVIKQEEDAAITAEIPAATVIELPPVEPMESSAIPAPAPPVEQMEVRQSSPVKELQIEPQQEQSQALIVNEQNQDMKNAIAAAVMEAASEKLKKEAPPVPPKPRTKKAKKGIKKPPVEPVSETAIPLPAPGQSI